MTDKLAKIYELIPKVAKDIGAIGKDGKNKMQNYSFRGIDDVYQSSHSAFVKHGIFSVPEVLNMAREERKSTKGATLLYTILTVKYTFYAPDGSSVKCVTMGEAMDSGDKSCNKAMSAAHKYAILQVFTIPTEEPKDTENDSHEVVAKTITKSEAGLLASLAEEVEADIAKFFKFFKITNFEELSASRYQEALVLLEKKKADAK